MFIMTQVNINQDLIQVFDTKDNTNEYVKLSIIAGQVRNSKIRIYGVGKLSKSCRNDCIPIAPYDIYVSFNEAKEALATYYQQNGVPRAQARRQVGLAG